jgi:peptidyl-prolyl cis-trans isomerase A (cyclophilin A)
MTVKILRAACAGLMFSLLGVVATAAEKAPETFQVKFETTKGDFVVDVTRSWSPIGADRFHELVKSGFYDECRFFRVVPRFIVQFGINGDPKTQEKWREAKIEDDPKSKTNAKGTVTFATAGPGTRTSQLFINFGNNAFLDDQGFTPFGAVSDEGMKIVEKITAEYAEEPNQGQIQSRGNAYLKENFPNMDYIKKATIVKPKEGAKGS